VSTLVVVGNRPLLGRLRVPGDKSISHRAVLLAARAEGTSVLRGLADGDDVARTLAAVTVMGAEVAVGPPGECRVTGGLERLGEPETVLDVGNSGTGIRLLAGFCAPFDWLTVLAGDESVGRRPMDRVAEPLRSMGAVVDGRDGGRYPPLVLRGGGLHGIRHTPAVASAQVKSAVLLAGLDAAGETVVHEPVATRAHTEEMLAACGADIEVQEAGGGRTVRVRRSSLAPFALDVPGDPSQAAFWVVAGCITPGSDVIVDDVYLGPGRAGFLDVLASMGADVERIGETAVRARYGRLRGTEVGPDEVPALIDEIPVLGVAAAVADGPTLFGGAGELRVKESDRIAAIVANLRAVGADAEELPDGLVVRGGDHPLRGRVVTHGDHRIAMAFGVLAALPGNQIEIDDRECAAVSFPGFWDTIGSLILRS
jgi:3-phosphoshikimate 1-carboxyvinyltransferase